jgi:hypothetical protein
MRLLPTRVRPVGPRRLRTALIVLGTVLVLFASSSCRPPRNGVTIARNIAWIQLNQRHWIPQAKCLLDLWNAESGWNIYAINKATGAFGIPQALPANRMRSAGPNWVNDPATQIRWGLTYIQQRYGGPCNAWQHFRRFHWYLQPSEASGTAEPPVNAN